MRSIYTFHLNCRVYTIRALIQEKEMKVKQIGNENIKLALFEDDIILYIRGTKDSTRNLYYWWTFPVNLKNFAFNGW